MSDQDWLATPFTFHDENATQVTMTAADILDTVTQLHYRYDDSLPPVTARLRDLIAVSTPPPPLPQGPPRYLTPAPGTPGSAYDAAPATTPHIARVSLSFTP